MLRRVATVAILLLAACGGDGETIRTVDGVGNASPGLVRNGQVWIPDHFVSSIEVWVASYGDGVVEILE